MRVRRRLGGPASAARCATHAGKFVATCTVVNRSSANEKKVFASRHEGSGGPAWDQGREREHKWRAGQAGPAEAGDASKLSEHARGQRRAGVGPGEREGAQAESGAGRASGGRRCKQAQ